MKRQTLVAQRARIIPILRHIEVSIACFDLEYEI